MIPFGYGSFGGWERAPLAIWMAGMVVGESIGVNSKHNILSFGMGLYDSKSMSRYHWVGG